MKRMITFLAITLMFSYTGLAKAEEKKENLVWDAGTVQLQLEKLATGVYAVYPTDAKVKNKKGYPVATSGGFVVGDNEVLVIESMVNKRLAKQVIGFVKQVTDKPIRYVVNTSYHGDHAYGNYAFPKTAKIIQHSKTKAFMENKEAFEADKKFMAQYFGAGRGIEDVIARTADIIIDDKKSIDLGNKKVEIMHLGFAQTEGDLFVWVPGEKVFWTGNPIVAMPPALPWLLDGKHEEVLATMKKVRSFLPQDAIIVPGHGIPIEPKNLDFTISYLETLHVKVKSSIDKYMALEDAQKYITMKDFQGYALWDWVHTGVNVPNTFKDLSK
ncbi:MAG: MBL fold metallo-hydrolase [Nitrospina sp.]|jgi:cyclase|nr:MBL fold metallo-hydrolase [Nitrospina sp.]MBT3507924.1 MBL fold metallo-hydrolase [Nitrospina sp.]MBT3876450.1 MBL fold metallo-hydrolase [Nitrospina sp.]MBT4048729.1 MBL fold metallo-hydrolase [Nitrospina sp.]MBT4558036.1 MBL fold metallo-hydrolase [Nitrospina sp.]